MATHPKPRLSPEDYLELERRAEFRSEYVAGEIFAMAGATATHNRIKGNTEFAIRSQIQGGACVVYSSDMKVWIPACQEFLYPDLVVVCGEQQFRDEMEEALLNPVVLIEVLSPTTANYDRGDKFLKYQQIPTFTEYLLIAQTAVRVDHYQRLSAQEWHFTIYTAAEDQIRLASVPVELTLREVYAGVGVEKKVSDK